MSTEQHQELALRPVAGSSLQEVMALGRVFKASGYFRDVRDEAQAVTKILYGRELGFTPIVSIMGIYIIEGKPSLASNLLATLVKRSGKYDYRVKENTAERCAILFRERVEGHWEDLGVTDFTIEEAKQAGVLSKDNWRKYAKAMLFARALSAGVRTHCPDVSVCPVYVPEELGADVNEEGEVKGATVQPEVHKEPISFKRSAPNPQPVVTPGEPVESSGEGEAVSQAGAVTHSTAEPAADLGNGGKLTGGSEASCPAVEYITPQQQSNFHRECRKAVPEAKKLDADNLTYEWLKDNGYVNEQGEPTAAKIPAAGWLDLRHKACTWLRVQ